MSNHDFDVVTSDEIEVLGTGALLPPDMSVLSRDLPLVSYEDFEALIKQAAAYEGLDPDEDLWAGDPDFHSTKEAYEDYSAWHATGTSPAMEKAYQKMKAELEEVFGPEMAALLLGK